MEQQEIMNQARRLMDHHGLTDWSLKKSNAVQIAGMCYRNRKQISLSMKLLPNWPTDKVLDTVLHEIAHALTPNDKGHGDEWKAKCVEVGADPTRCYDGNTLPKVEHKWSVTCECGKVQGKAHRRKTDTACRLCKGPALYYETGADPRTAVPFYNKYRARCHELAKQWGVEYYDGAFFAPDNKRWTYSGGSVIDTELISYREASEWMELGLEDTVIIW